MKFEGSDSKRYEKTSDHAWELEIFYRINSNIRISLLSGAYLSDIALWRGR